jgi:hypothetical protein
MSNFQGKYRNKAAALFLCVYLSFLVVGIFHHHHYDLDNPQSFDVDSNHVPLASFGLTNDYSPCFLNSFSSTILNYEFASVGIVKPLTACCEKLFVERKNFISYPHFNNLTLRAPPAIS